MLVVLMMAAPSFMCFSAACAIQKYPNTLLCGSGGRGPVGGAVARRKGDLGLDGGARARRV